MYAEEGVMVLVKGVVRSDQVTTLIVGGSGGYFLVEEGVRYTAGDTRAWCPAPVLCKLGLRLA